MSELFHDLAVEQEERKWAEKAKADSEAWKAKWPNHCSVCGGWGTGPTWYENHGIPGPGEPMCDPCQEPTDPKECHRCGEPGLDDDGNGPCTKCQWNFDDGDPAARS